MVNRILRPGAFVFLHLTCVDCIHERNLADSRNGSLDAPLRPLYSNRIEEEVTSYYNVPKTDRIVGGEPAELGEFPSYAFSVEATLCGGTVIWPDIILTAAHCESKTWEPGALIGGTDIGGSESEFISVVESIAHPDYDSFTRDNDLMIVKLESSTSAPIQELNINSTIPIVDEILTVIGFGNTADGGNISDVLLKVNVNAVSDGACRAAWGDLFKPEIHVCAGDLAGGKDSCQGDSGGPLQTESGIQVGIVSFGKGCAEVNTPAIYTRVSYYKQWIQDIICDLSNVPPSDCADDTSLTRAPTDKSSFDTPSPNPTTTLSPSPSSTVSPSPSSTTDDYDTPAPVPDIPPVAFARVGEFPSYAFTSGDTIICGGSLVYPDLLLTSARCASIYSLSEQVFIGGISLNGVGSEALIVEQTIPNPDYNPNSETNNIMIVKLSRPSTARLQRLNSDTAIPEIGSSVIVIGFDQGYSRAIKDGDEALLKETLTVLDHDECGLFWGSSYNSDLHLCTTSGSCVSNNAGAPLLTTKGIQIGIAASKCIPSKPVIYTRVAAYDSWILQTIEEASDYIVPPGKKPIKVLKNECDSSSKGSKKKMKKRKKGKSSKDCNVLRGKSKISKNNSKSNGKLYSTIYSALQIKKDSNKKNYQKPQSDVELDSLTALIKKSETMLKVQIIDGDSTTHLQRSDGIYNDQSVSNNLDNDYISIEVQGTHGSMGQKRPHDNTSSYSTFSEKGSIANHTSPINAQLSAEAVNELLTHVAANDKDPDDSTLESLIDKGPHKSNLRPSHLSPVEIADLVKDISKQSDDESTLAASDENPGESTLESLIDKGPHISNLRPSHTSPVEKADLLKDFSKKSDDESTVVSLIDEGTHKIKNGRAKLSPGEIAELLRDVSTDYKPSEEENAVSLSAEVTGNTYSSETGPYIDTVAQLLQEALTENINSNETSTESASELGIKNLIVGPHTRR